MGNCQASRAQTRESSPAGKEVPRHPLKEFTEGTKGHSVLATMSPGDGPSIAPASTLKTQDARGNNDLLHGQGASPKLSLGGAKAVPLRKGFYPEPDDLLESCVVLDVLLETEVALKSLREGLGCFISATT